MPAVRKDPDIGTVKWIKCRAKNNCEGNDAKVVMKFKLPTGGTSIRYRCQKCNRIFHITF